MKVRFRNPDMSDCPSQVEPYARDPNLTPGKTYDAHAVSVYEGVTLMQVVDDLNYPGWKPAWLFECIDTSIPSDWICNVFADAPELLFGPKFIAESQEAHSAMVELEPGQVDQFHSRVRALARGQKDER